MALHIAGREMCQIQDSLQRCWGLSASDFCGPRPRSLLRRPAAAPANPTVAVYPAVCHQVSFPAIGAPNTMILITVAFG